MDERRFEDDFGALFEELGKRRGDCPAAEQLIAFDAGELNASDRLQLEQHVELCPSCRQLVEALASAPDDSPEAGSAPPAPTPDVAEPLPARPSRVSAYEFSRAIVAADWYTDRSDLSLYIARAAA